jgi:two-component system, LytTR family, response regulator
MKVAIIEDESLAAEKLENLLFEINPKFEICAKLKSVSESIGWLSNNSADILFVDIQLSDGISFEIFEKVQTYIPIIFTTAYDQFAIQAFKLNSIDYLLKPVRKVDLEISLNKYEKVRLPVLNNFEDIFRSLFPNQVSYKKRFLINYGNKLKMVETENIAFFWAREKNVFLSTFDRNIYPVDFSLDKLKEQLNPEIFFRINRKMIINLKAIMQMHSYSRSRIKLDLSPPEPKGIEALVSIERSSDFKNWMNK